MSINAVRKYLICYALLHKHPERTQVCGFDRSQSSKAMQAEKGVFTDTVNALTKNTYPDIIRSVRIRSFLPAVFR